jgi:hypothetical protein
VCSEVWGNVIIRTAKYFLIEYQYNLFQAH